MLNAPFKFFSVFIAVIIIFGLVAGGKIEFFQPKATEVMTQQAQLDLEARSLEIEATRVATNLAQEQAAVLHDIQMDEAKKQSVMRLQQEAERQELWLWGEEILLYILMGFAALMGLVPPAILFYTGVRWVNIALPTPRLSRRPRFTPTSTQELLPPTTLRSPFIAASRQNDTVQWTPVKIRPRRRERNYHS